MNYTQYEPLFGSWYITEEIGSGAEGSLYRIRRTDALGHEYYSALKAVSVPASESETASLMAGGMTLDEVAEYYESVLENTTQEFELLAKLKGNSNIVSYEDHEIFRHDNGIGWDILIRLEELTPLVSYSIDKPLSADEVARMARDICRGLSLCKKFGIVHRDIKPDNIFISPSGSYKLGDFGIARIIEKTTMGLSRKGTYEYMAPEVYWGREYGSSVDLYSLGMVMYRYLNDGRMPFMPQSPEPIHAGDREEAFVKRVNGHEIPSPRCGSEELKRIVLKACAYDRSDRYEDADAMLMDLEALETGTTEGVRVHKKRKKKGKGRIIALIAAVLCVVTAAAVWAMIPKEVEDIDIGDAEGSDEIYIGDDLALTYTVLPDRFKDEPVTFKSGDESIFTVDDKGVIHAKSLGDAKLTMTAKEYSEEVSVSVVPKVTSISGVDGSISMTTGDTLELKPELSPEKFAGEPLTFSTDDEKVATVSEEGKITAVSAGGTKLIISAGGCTFTASINVSDPVIYYPPATSKKKSSGSTKRSSGSKKKSSGSSGANKGYFDSGDDEHF